MDPSRLKAFMDQPAGTVSNAALKPSNARQSKRLFVYNLPPSVTEDSIVQFFNLQLNGLNVTQGYDPCISAQMSRNRDFALLEFKSPTDATVALAFDGITMEEHDAVHTNGHSNGSARGLDIRRPKDYIVPSAGLASRGSGASMTAGRLRSWAVPGTMAGLGDVASMIWRISSARVSKAARISATARFRATGKP